jgi:hypothetical protein
MTDREDKYIIEWTPIREGQPDESKYATLTITELWSIGHIIFKAPLKIDVFFGPDDDGNEEALAVYDFGMSQRIALSKEHNFLYNYAGSNEDVEPIKTVFATIKFDLMHAFFHYDGDPNYGHLHWALRGNLEDHLSADDSFIFDDWEKQNEAKNENKN